MLFCFWFWKQGMERICRINRLWTMMLMMMMIIIMHACMHAWKIDSFDSKAFLASSTSCVGILLFDRWSLQCEVGSKLWPLDPLDLQTYLPNIAGCRGSSEDSSYSNATAHKYKQMQLGLNSMVLFGVVLLFQNPGKMWTNFKVKEILCANLNVTIFYNLENFHWRLLPICTPNLQPKLFDLRIQQEQLSHSSLPCTLQMTLAINMDGTRWI